MKKKIISTSKMKQLVVLIEPEHFVWLKQSSKNQKVKMAHFVRNMIGYLMASNPKEIHNKLAEARLKAELETAQKAFDLAAKVKEAKEQELAEIIG